MLSLAWREFLAPLKDSPVCEMNFCFAEDCWLRPAVFGRTGGGEECGWIFNEKTSLVMSRMDYKNCQLQLKSIVHCKVETVGFDGKERRFKEKPFCDSRSGTSRRCLCLYQFRQRHYSA